MQIRVVVTLDEAYKLAIIHRVKVPFIGRRQLAWNFRSKVYCSSIVDSGD